MVPGVSDGSMVTGGSDEADEQQEPMALTYFPIFIKRLPHREPHLPSSSTLYPSPRYPPSPPPRPPPRRRRRRRHRHRHHPPPSATRTAFRHFTTLANIAAQGSGISDRKKLRHEAYATV
jgi:hypothetical protein